MEVLNNLTSVVRCTAWICAETSTFTHHWFCTSCKCQPSEKCKCFMYCENNSDLTGMLEGLEGYREGTHLGSTSIT